MAKEIVLLTVQGKLVNPDEDTSRKVHNQVAGSDQAVAAARAMGDLSHLVYWPVAKMGQDGNFLIMDLWNDVAGMQKFFAGEQVQKGGSMLFASREAAVWNRAADFASFDIAPPKGKNDRFVGLVRGAVRSREGAREVFNALTDDTINEARKLGQISHAIYFRIDKPDELLGVDVWSDAQGMGKFYADPQHLAPLKNAFAAAPATSIWRQPEGSWVEW